VTIYHKKGITAKSAQKALYYRISLLHQVRIFSPVIVSKTCR